MLLSLFLYHYKLITGVAIITFSNAPSNSMIAAHFPKKPNQILILEKYLIY